MLRSIIATFFNRTKKGNAALIGYGNDVITFFNHYYPSAGIIGLTEMADKLAAERPLIYKEIEKKLINNYFYALNTRQRLGRSGDSK